MYSIVQKSWVSCLLEPFLKFCQENSCSDLFSHVQNIHGITEFKAKHSLYNSNKL